METTLVDDLARNESEMTEAARRGDTAELRRLKQQKRAIETQAQVTAAQQQANMQAHKPSMELPGHGEEKRLAESGRDLSAKITRLLATRENDLAALGQQPDSDSLAAKLDNCDAQIASAQRQLEAIRARQAQIERWHEEQEGEGRRQQEAKERESRLAEQAALELKAASLPTSVTSNWTQLLSSLTALDEVEAKLKELTQLKNLCPPVRDARAAIAKATARGVLFVDGGRYPNRWVINFTVEVESEK